MHSRKFLYGRNALIKRRIMRFSLSSTSEGENGVQNPAFKTYYENLIFQKVSGLIALFR